VAALIAASISPVSASSTDAPQGSTAYTDRQIVEAVTFGTGPAANLVNLSAENLQKVYGDEEYSAASQVAEAILDDIEAHEPGAISALAQELRSGDPFVVANAIDHRDALTLASLERIHGKEAVDRAFDAIDTPRQQACSVFFVCGAYVLAAVHFAAAATFFAAVAMVWVLTTGTEVAVVSIDEPHSAGKDAYVADLTSLLALSNT